MEKIQYIVKGFFNTVLPFVDLGTDIKFTYDMYLNNDNFQLVHMLRDCYKSENEQINCVFIISGKGMPKTENNPIVGVKIGNFTILVPKVFLFVGFTTLETFIEF